MNALFHSYALVFPALKDRFWKIDYHGRILKKLEGLSLTPRLIQEKGRPISTRIRNEMDEGEKRPRTTPWKEGGGGGRCNASCVTKRGITEEHALSRTRYRRVVVLWTRYAKFEPWHPSKCNLKQNAWYMPLDQNACYIPFNYVFLKLKKNWIKFKGSNMAFIL